MTSLRFSNSLTQKKDIFLPINPDHVTIYVCGPTVYDRAHIGNARSAVVFDTLVRLLRVSFPKVTYARNITDVDDKINAKSKDTGRTIKDITTETLGWYHHDMRQLNVVLPDIEPKATDHIPQMLAMIEVLIAKEHAYENQNHVLFDTTTFEEYGKFSRKNADDLIAGARVEVAPYKKNASDFVLWKPSAADEPGWESPYGFGRPGWHIECSAMSSQYFGKEFDIHGGGIDLLFPHHENEIAQSCCAHDHSTMSKIWIHNGHLTVDGSKMSKSLRNFITVTDLLASHHPQAIRLALLMSHYHQPLDWSSFLLSSACSILNRFYGIFEIFSIDDPRKLMDQNDLFLKDDIQEVLDILSDDLNTPKLLSSMHQWADQLYKQKNDNLLYKFLYAGKLMGLFYHSTKEWFQFSGLDGLSDVEIEKLIEERSLAKLQKNFQKADDIRKYLIEKGYALLDGLEGTTWRKL